MRKKVSSTTSTNMAYATAVTTVTANAGVILLGMASSVSSGTSWSNTLWSTTAPGTLTEILDTIAGSSSADRVTVGAAWGTLATAGSTGTGSARLTNTGRTGGILVALRPASTQVADATNSTVSASPASVVADNVATSTVTVVLKDASSSVVPGKVVALAKFSGVGSPSITTNQGTSDASGVARFSVKSVTAGGTTFQATDVTDGNLVITQKVTVSFTPGAVSAGNSTVSVSTNSVVADGVATSVVTVVLKDANNNLVTNKTVTLAKLSGPGSPIITTNQATTDASGVALFSVASTTAGADVFQATGDGVVISQTATVTSTAGPAAAGTSTVSASPGSVPADGVHTSTITVTLKDAYNNLVTNKTVTLASDRGATDTISGASGPSDVNGQVTFTVKSTTTGSPIFTATDTSDAVTITQTATVTFTTVPPADAANSTVSAFPTTVPSDGVSTSTVTVTLKDAGNNPVAGKAVMLASDRGATDTISSPSGSSDISGIVTFTVKSSTGGTATLTATDTTDGVTITQTATVTFVSAPTKLVYTSVPSTGTAGTPFSVTVQAQDDGSNPAGVGSDTTVTLSKASGGGILSGVLSGIIALGSNSVTISTPVYSKADTMTLKAAAPGLTDVTSGDIVFAPGPVSAGTSTVSASPSNVVADGVATSTVTVTLMDANGNTVSNKTVDLLKISGPGTPAITTLQGTSDAAGVATFTVASTTTGTDVFRATNTTDNIAIAQTASVTFTAGAVVDGNCTVSASPGSLPADGVTTSTVTVTLKDVFANGVPGKTVTLASSRGSAVDTISPASGISDASGTVTFTVKSTKQGAAVFTATNTTDNITLSQTAAVTFTPDFGLRGAATTASTSGNSLTIAMPAGVVEGDVMIVNIAQYGSSSSSPTLSNGWTSIRSGQLGNSSFRYGAVAYKVAGAGEAGPYTFTLNGTVSGAGGAIVAYSGVDTAAVIEASSNISGSSGASTSVSASSITTVYSNAMVIMFGMGASTTNAAAGGTWSGWSASLTELYDYQTSGTSNTAVSVGAAYKKAVVPGSTGTGSATLTAAMRNGGTFVALKLLTAPANAANSTLTASPATVRADGYASTTNTLTLLDGSGNPVPGKTVSLRSSRGGTDTISPASRVTDSAGMATFAVRSSTVGSPVFTATDLSDGFDVSQTATMDFIANPPADPALSTVTAAPLSAAADGVAASTVTVTLVESGGTPVAAKDMTLASNRGTNDTISPALRTSNASGVGTFTVRSTTPGPAVLSATVTNDGVTVLQTATVTFIGSTNKDILTFTFPTYGAASIAGTNISITVPFATVVTNLAPTYTVSTFASGAPASGSAQNFTTPQVYTVTAQDGSTKAYLVTVNITPPTTVKDILTFGTNVAETGAVIDTNLATVAWTVPYGTAVTNLAPTYTLSTNATGVPVSGTSQDFTSPQTYTITAQDSSIKIYTVTVTVAPPSTAKDILTFGTNVAGSITIIDTNAATVTWNLSFGTAVTNLAAAYTVSSKATGAPVSGTSRNFTTPQTYTITAQDGSTKIYTVTARVAAGPQGYGISGDTDLAQEFSPMNRSGHPVVTGLNNYSNSPSPRNLATGQLKAPWNVNVGSQTMLCSDCHDATTTNMYSAATAQGPHGSANQYMLRGPNATNWPNVPLSSYSTNWCANCHSAARSANNVHNAGNHDNYRCYQCHIVIPHGGKMSRLIADRDSYMPARYALSNDVNNVSIRSFTKTSPSSYSSDDVNCRVSCSHHSTTASATMENW